MAKKTNKKGVGGIVFYGPRNIFYNLLVFGLILGLSSCVSAYSGGEAPATVVTKIRHLAAVLQMPVLTVLLRWTIT